MWIEEKVVFYGVYTRAWVNYEKNVGILRISALLPESQQLSMRKIMRKIPDFA